jgi:hypothetical protein
LEEAGQAEEGGDVATVEEGEEDDVQRCKLYAFSAAMLIAYLPVFSDGRSQCSQCTTGGVLPTQTIDINRITVLAVGELEDRAEAKNYTM